MDQDGSSLGDEAQEPEARPTSSEATDRDLEVREPYLRRVLGEFEAGRLEAYEYTRRVLAINATSSTAEMERIAGQSQEDWFSTGARGGLDAVDLARMRSPASSAHRTASARYIALGIVFVMFAVLIGIGMWLAMHVHGAAFHAHGTLGHAVALAAAPWR